MSAKKKAPAKKAKAKQKAAVKVVVAEVAEAAKEGRPTDYKAEFCDAAKRLCLLGAKDKDLADFFACAESTLNLWKLEHPEFSESLKAGKEEADANVARSLYHRALGYKHDAVKILAVGQGANQGSVVEQVPYIEHYPPDTAAGIFWLKNRRPDLWRDKVESEVTGAGGGPLQVVVRVAREGRRITAS